MRKIFKQDGSSLIEVIVSLLMVAVLLVLYASALNTVRQARKLRNENIAYHIANKEMESLRNISYASLPANGVINDALLSQLPSGAGTYTTGAYPGYANVKEIVVTVTWNDGLARQILLKSLSGIGGLNP